MIAFADDWVVNVNAHNPGKHPSPLVDRKTRGLEQALSNIRTICVVSSHTGTAKSTLDVITARSNCVWDLREAGRGP